jgi:hypothetical protein
MTYGLLDNFTERLLVIYDALSGFISNKIVAF